jgi:uncharacterized protein (UPF0264 family)
MPSIDSNDDFRHSLMTGSSSKLLVSVRSATEFNDAFAAAVDIIDLKEPLEGPLAPAPVDLWLQAAKRLKSRKKSSPLLSAALGESDVASRVACRLPPEFDFAKAGPSGCNSARQLENLWMGVRAELNNSISLVAVAYADHAAADCLPPTQVFKLAADSGIEFCLLDTFCKNGRSTIDHLGITGLRDLQKTVNQFDLWWALAGSLTDNSVTKVHEQGLQPNCFGVRGDVCVGDRTGRLATNRIEAWKSKISVTWPNQGLSNSSDALRSCQSNHPPKPRLTSDAALSRHDD